MDLTKVGGNDWGGASTPHGLGVTVTTKDFGAVSAFKTDSNNLKFSTDVKKLSDVKTAKKRRQFDSLLSAAPKLN